MYTSVGVKLMVLNEIIILLIINYKHEKLKLFTP